MTIRRGLQGWSEPPDVMPCVQVERLKSGLYKLVLNTRRVYTITKGYGMD